MSFFIRGQVITNLEELYNQEFIIYLMGPRCKVLHRGWFVSWQLSFTKRLIESRLLYKAERINEDD